MERHEERRKNGGLSDDEIQAIKDAILNSIYEEIGRSIVKRLLWSVGAVILAVASWLGFNHIVLK